MVCCRFGLVGWLDDWGDALRARSLGIVEQCICLYPLAFVCCCVGLLVVCQYAPENSVRMGCCCARSLCHGGHGNPVFCGGGLIRSSGCGGFRALDRAFPQTPARYLCAADFLHCACGDLLQRANPIRALAFVDGVGQRCRGGRVHFYHG